MIGVRDVEKSFGVEKVLLGLAATAIGAFASLFAENEFQIIQFIPVFIVLFSFANILALKKHRRL
jgi:hypothetical protein